MDTAGPLIYIKQFHSLSKLNWMPVIFICIQNSQCHG